MKTFYLGRVINTLVHAHGAKRIFGAGEISLVQRDASHNSLLATEQSGSITAQLQIDARHDWITYSPYGCNVQNPRTQRLAVAFNGELFDSAVGGYLLGNGHRAFLPAQRRFTSPDMLSPFGAGGLNCYAYCSNDPINYQDQSGKFKLPTWLRQPSPRYASTSKVGSSGYPIPHPYSAGIKKNFKWTARIDELSQATLKMTPKEFETYFDTYFPMNSVLRDAVSATNATYIAISPPSGFGMLKAGIRRTGLFGWGGTVKPDQFRGVTTHHAERVNNIQQKWQKKGFRWFRQYQVSDDLPELLDYFQEIRMGPKLPSHIKMPHRISHLHP